MRTLEEIRADTSALNRETEELLGNHQKMNQEAQNGAQQNRQIIKARDDRNPVYFQRNEETLEDPSKPFQIGADTDCSWAKKDKFFGPEKLRPRIEPWLTALVQSEHLSLLVGSGLTHAVHELASGDAEVLSNMSLVNFSTFNEEIKNAAENTAKKSGRGSANFEDQIRVANELLRGLEIEANASEKASDLRKEIKERLGTFACSILKGEHDIVEADNENHEKALNYLVSFLMSFASRSGTRERLHLFTTNYDRLIEAGADRAGLRLIDRFVGALTPVFRASRLDVDLHYNPPGIRGEPRYLEGVARFTKLHGSVDWLDCDKLIRRVGLPFGAEDVTPYLALPGFEGTDAMSMMIYPNAAKDRETTYYPYVELFRDFAAALCRPNSTLICYGYGFGDEHINRVIEDMLTIPSTHLVIISYDDSYGRIMNTYERLGRAAQITLMIGDHLGNLRKLVNHYLPKPAIDHTTLRMVNLLKARGDVPSINPDSDNSQEKQGHQQDDSDSF